MLRWVRQFPGAGLGESSSVEAHPSGRLFILLPIPALAATVAGLARRVAFGAFFALFAVMLMLFLDQRCPDGDMAYHLSLKPPGVYDHLVPVECPQCHEPLA